MHESPIVQKAIDALLYNDQVGITTEGIWLSRATLAPKAYQGKIIDIDEFVWRFCINYMPLNQRTLTVAYPIP